MPCLQPPLPATSAQVNQTLQLMSTGRWVDATPAHERSPSPEPVYNESGARINTRDARARDKLTRKRNVSCLHEHGLQAAVLGARAPVHCEGMLGGLDGMTVPACPAFVWAC